MTVADLAKRLINTFDTNRVRHGTCWEKVRRDRVHKLLPELEEHTDVEQVVSFALAQGTLKACQKMCDEDQVPALKLTKWNYRRELYEYDYSR